eukprot:478276-Lingulodinium_polyedra.AAC.1
MRTAFLALGKFWSSEHVPLAWRKRVFYNAIVDAAVSGIEAMFPTEGQYKRLTAQCAKYGRVLFCGGACSFDGPHPRSWPSIE